jgi:glycosyltransferase involved in cell wall biosynthesis
MSEQQKPRILMYWVLLTATGGAQHTMSLLAEELSYRGYDIVFFTRPPYEPNHRYVTWLSRGNIPVHVLERYEERPRNRRLAALAEWLVGIPLGLRHGLTLTEARKAGRDFALARIKREEERDIRETFSRFAEEGRRDGRPVILHLWGPALLTPLLLDWAEKEGVPSIYHEMGEADQEYVKTWFLEETCQAINRADRAIAVSPSVAENVRTVFGYRGPVDAIPDTIMNPKDEWLVRARQAGGRVTFGAIGRLVPHKRHNELIRAVRWLVDEGHDVGLVIASDGPMRGPLEELASDLGVADRVTFLGEFEDLTDVMAQFDVFTLTSHSESQCMPVTESMSYGKPVIVTRFGGIPDFVVDGVTGILVDVGNLDQLVAAMRRLVEDPELREDMGRRGRERFLEHYTPERVADRVEDVYRELLEKAE